MHQKLAMGVQQGRGGKNKRQPWRLHKISNQVKNDRHFVRYEVTGRNWTFFNYNFERFQSSKSKYPILICPIASCQTKPDAFSAWFPAIHLCLRDIHWSCAKTFTQTNSPQGVGEVEHGMVAFPWIKVALDEKFWRIKKHSKSKAHTLTFNYIVYKEHSLKGSTSKLEACIKFKKKKALWFIPPVSVIKCHTVKSKHNLKSKVNSIPLKTPSWL